MSLLTITYIALAAILALGLAFFQYFYKARKKGRNAYIFLFLRFAGIFIVLLLLINPKMVTRSYEVEKPNLVLAVDNSASIAQLKQQEQVERLIKKLKENKFIQQNFDLSEYSFGKGISSGDSLQFDQSQTNINAALNDLKDLYKRRNAAVILITDGNQTMGRDYSYFKTSGNTQLFPVVAGDTSNYADLQLSRLNVNRYVFLNNRFPVEAILNYYGTDPVTTQFQIKSGDAVVFTQKLSFDSEKSSAVVHAELPAKRLGVLTYEAELVPSSEEKNIRNNTEKFAVEVIDERSRILLLSAHPHPDLGVIKKSVESNRQRKLDIKYLKNHDFQLKDYQLVIAYQPNNSFSNVLNEARELGMNYMIVTGTETDWNFLNNFQENFSKDYTSQPQEIFAVMNPNFGQFQFEDIGFEDFPPLEDKFGVIKTKSQALNSLLFQKIEGVETSQPLLAIFEKNGRKAGFLFGENIWRWRAASYLRQQSFEEFDNFFGKVIQNLASKKHRERLTLDYDSFYYGNQEIGISAQYFDENYEFDPRAQLEISLKNENSEEESRAAFLLRNNNYSVELGNLEPGEYSFVVKEQNSGISKSGSFKVIDYNVEQQFVSANLDKMKQLAANNHTKVYFPSDPVKLVEALQEDKAFVPVQKSHEKTVPLIEWYYLLFLLALLFAAEWFYRKYLGLI